MTSLPEEIQVRADGPVRRGPRVAGGTAGLVRGVDRMEHDHAAGSRLALPGQNTTLHRGPRVGPAAAAAENDNGQGGGQGKPFWHRTPHRLVLTDDGVAVGIEVSVAVGVEVEVGVGVGVKVGVEVDVAVDVDVAEAVGVGLCVITTYDASRAATSSPAALTLRQPM